jgi:hypothetical protein
MKEAVKDAILSALEGIKAELVQIHADTGEIRKELTEMKLLNRTQHAGLLRRVGRVEDEGARHERIITDLQRRVAAGR